MADDPSNTIRIPVEDAIDRFLELERGDEWIRRISQEQFDLIQWYIVEGRPCTEGLRKQAEDAFLLRERMRQQREDGYRWLRTHVHIECGDVTRPTDWDDADSKYRTKVTQEQTVSLTELEQELRKRFGERAEQQIARLAGTAPAEESSVADVAPSPSVPEATSETPPKRGTKRGRPPHEFWPWVENYIFGLLDRHGLPGFDNRRLPTQAALEELAKEFMQQEGWDAADSKVRQRVAGMIKYFGKRGPKSP
jgi:hypothetical protein